MKAIKEQIDEQPKIIKLFSINYARDLLYCVFGGNDSGKSSIGDAVETLAYRAMNSTYLHLPISLDHLAS